jgi:hypothetical protein
VTTWTYLACPYLVDLVASIVPGGGLAEHWQAVPVVRHDIPHGVLFTGPSYLTAHRHGGNVAKHDSLNDNNTTLTRGLWCVAGVTVILTMRCHLSFASVDPAVILP